MKLLCPVLGLLAACGGMHDPSTVEQQHGACVELEGRRFESVDDLECGLTPNGVAFCKWSVTFGMRDELTSSFQWTYSDVGEAGNVECDGGTITSIASSRAVSGSFDPTTNRLVWEGQTYVLVP